MEKEMKKLLLVAVSVGVFLLVTITVALIVITPKPQTQETAFSSSVPYTQASPGQNNTNNLSAQSDVNNIPLAVFYEGNERQEVTIASDRNDGNSLTIHVPTPVSTVNETTRAVAVQTPSTQQAARTPPASAPKPSAPGQTTDTPRSSTAAARSTTQPSNPSRPVSTPARPSAGKTINDYWVQTGAFSAIVRAEDARELLASKGIVSIIENRVIDGRTWYRVRLGPYTSEREASHWLAIVKAIDGFDQSQIRQTVRQQ